MSSGQDLIARAKSGDPDALEQLIRGCASGVRAHLERMVGERMRRNASVSDLEQEVLARSREVLGRLPEGAGTADFENLLHRHVSWVVGNAVERGRRFEGETAAPHGPCDEAAVPLFEDGTVTRADERSALEAAIATLPDELASVVRARAEGSTWAKVGTQLGISEDAARKRFVRAARMLRDRLPEL